MRCAGMVGWWGHIADAESTSSQPATLAPPAIAIPTLKSGPSKTLRVSAVQCWAHASGVGKRGRRDCRVRFPTLEEWARSNTRSEEHTSELQSLAYLVCR